jgi:hypothetical protein
MGIWVAIALGTALATAARRGGHLLSARTGAQRLAPYRRLHDHRVDCFVLGVVAGSVSSAPLNGLASTQFGVWAGLLLGFAAFSAADDEIDATACSICQRAVRKMWRLVLGPAAVVAGWLCAGTIAR